MSRKKHYSIHSQYITAEGARGSGRHQLYSFDTYSDIPAIEEHPYVEVQFKNTRKEIFFNPLGIPLSKEDMVAVEGSPGLDIGRVSLVGPAADLQMRANGGAVKGQPKQIYRLATEHDLERYRASKALEHRTMIQSRQIAVELGLEMKIGDVEYQGDGTKAIFYYIAEGRVDFRQLIRVLASTFHIRIEMRQIGARQETGRIGGIGPCGRQLCCSSWMKNFHSVNTQAARFQDLPLNPDKLTGQCGKLKCCTNFEVDTYVEAQKKVPPRNSVLKTEEGSYHFVKADVLKGEVTYKLADDPTASHTTITTWRAKRVLKDNQEEVIPKTLLTELAAPQKSSVDILDTNSLTRFDQEKRRKRARRRGKSRVASSENRTNGTDSKERNNTSRREENGSRRKASTPRAKRPPRAKSRNE